VKRVTLALAACALIAYRKTPTARNLTDLACLLLATNVSSRPEDRYRTSRLKVLIKYYSALLVRCIGFRQHANLLVFYPMLFSCQTSSLAVPQDRTTWVVEQNKTAQSSKAVPSTQLPVPSKCFPTSSRFRCLSLQIRITTIPLRPCRHHRYSLATDH
jgi:hypothetical protein